MDLSPPGGVVIFLLRDEARVTPAIFILRVDGFYPSVPGIPHMRVEALMLGCISARISASTHSVLLPVVPRAQGLPDGEEANDEP